MDHSNIYCCSGPAGAGKTHAIVKKAKHDAENGEKILIVQPTKELIDKTISTEVGEPDFPVARFHGDVCGRNVVANLSQHFRGPLLGARLSSRRMRPCCGWTTFMPRTTGRSMSMKSSLIM